MRTFVIGDIHGCVDELAGLIEGLDLDPLDRVIFLGDYVDRGPNSKAVVSFLIDRRGAADMIFLKGNHEDMFLAYLGFPGKYGDMFLYNGGVATLASYGAAPHTDRSRLLALVPKAHLDFFAALKNYFIVDNFLCVHAGVHPNKELDLQEPEEMLWIRDEFILSRHVLPYTVLFGHTPQEEVLFHLPYKVGLDTGLVYGNRLSCLELEEKMLLQVARGTKTVTQRSVKKYWRDVLV